MYIIKEKEFLDKPLNKEEIRLVALRKSLYQAVGLGAKYDIGERIKTLKEGLVILSR